MIGFQVPLIVLQSACTPIGDAGRSQGFARTAALEMGASSRQGLLGQRSVGMCLDTMV